MGFGSNPKPACAGVLAARPSMRRSSWSAPVPAVSLPPWVVTDIMAPVIDRRRRAGGGRGQSAAFGCRSPFGAAASRAAQHRCLGPARNGCRRVRRSPCRCSMSMASSSALPMNASRPPTRSRSTTEKGVSIGGNRITGLGAERPWRPMPARLNSIALGNNALTDRQGSGRHRHWPGRSEVQARRDRLDRARAGRHRLGGKQRGARRQLHDHRLAGSPGLQSRRRRRSPAPSASGEVSIGNGTGISPASPTSPPAPPTRMPPISGS